MEAVPYFTGKIQQFIRGKAVSALGASQPSRRYPSFDLSSKDNDGYGQPYRSPDSYGPFFLRPLFAYQTNKQFLVGGFDNYAARTRKSLTPASESFTFRTPEKAT
jgi:hypothetical protein